jgi:hypothetical protein
MPTDPDWKEVDWPRLIKELLLWTASCLKKRIWLGEVNGTPPGALQTMDLVHNAILKTIDGDRPWKSEEKPLKDHLIDVISSELYHLVRRPENQNIRYSYINQFDANSRSDEYLLGRLNHNIQINENKLCPEEENIYCLEIRQEVKSLLSEDKEAHEVASLMIEGVVKPSILAEDLNRSVKDINNIIKRMMRKLRSLRNSESF